jgi:hypothetical protein
MVLANVYVAYRYNKMLVASVVIMLEYRVYEQLKTGLRPMAIKKQRQTGDGIEVGSWCV